MRTSIIAFALGVWLCQRLPVLPGPGWMLIASSISIAVGMVVLRVDRTDRRRRAVVCLLALAVGILWAAVRAHLRLSDELPMHLEGRDVVVIGVVDELPQRLEGGVRFVLRVESSAEPVPPRILLSWYGARGRRGEQTDDGGEPPDVHAGERWKLAVRLKRPHGFANPDGFDYEAWLLERGARATGSVRGKRENVLLDPLVQGPMVFVHRLRESIRERFLATLPDAEYAGVLVALAIGDQNGIPQAQWTVFRKTGISHLVSISGLHVSLAGLMVGGLVGWCWRRVPRLTLRCPARKAAAVAGLAVAAGYALLAGLGIPTQRSLIMLAVVAAAMLLGRETAGSRVIAAALLGVLIVDPWAVLSAGFWLSFGAVAVILYLLSGRLQRASGWRAAVVTQIGITVATIPALLVLFNAFSLVSPVANALAIPLVSFLVTPLALLAIGLPHASILELAHWLTGLMMGALEWLGALPFAMWQQAAPPPLLAAAGVIGVAWLMLPRGTPGRYAGALAVLPMLTWSPPRPAEGEFRVTVLDVGHGLAVHVQTAEHDLVYDAGPTYGPGADAGSRVILPYLAASGITRLDRLLISHDDLDHTGGMGALLDGVRVLGVTSNLPEDRVRELDVVAALPCQAGERWRWDGVDFEVLHPVPDRPPQGDNDGSCVLKIVAPGASALLTGDIERSAERSLVARSGPKLASDVVVVPHHGSRSSSSPAFVEAVGAEVAVFSVGNLNPFRHPHPAVWARWDASGARPWRTDSQGAVRIDVTADGVRTSAQRMLDARYWHGH
ncbi:DNA internalization-related competence protein ComEC/Rec2 [Aromatoleum sp.]|uniref:DNA internalization-related competence protein ComEC/Rec2 n=1 Tax=Aromatoleum sp. TaxID=2307007 RepID=UPI002FCAAA4D